MSFPARLVGVGDNAAEMAEPRSKNLGDPDETIDLPGVIQQQIDLGDLTVGRVTHEPGWRWSTHVRPQIGGDWCQARHVGIVLSGRLGALFEDGTTVELGPDDVYEIPPGHDGYVIGHEPCVVIEWSGLRAFVGFRGGVQGRALATLMLTEIADSAALANRLGDLAWREVLSAYFESARSELERFRGREVRTTGDGLLATFDGTAQALRCAAAICRRAAQHDLRLRSAVHVGEVELVGTDVRGAAVHETARIAEQAEAGEILLSETTRALALTSGLTFEDRGARTLSGLPGEWTLYAHVAEGESVTG
jgi:class 3 adenylate cyclase